MKLVREHINEKFKEESDPISDLGIGLDIPKEMKIFYQDFIELYPNLHIKYVNKLFDNGYFYVYVNRKKYIIELLTWGGFNIYTPTTNNRWSFVDYITTAKEFMPAIPRFKINEKFKEDSDPINDLKIGLPIAIPLMIKNIFTLDTENPDIEHLSKSDNSNIQIIFNDGITFSIEFYSNRHYTNSGEEIDKKEYAIKLLKESGLDQFVDAIPYNIEPPEETFKNDDLYSSWLFMFNIKKQYRNIFKQIEKQFTPPKIRF